MLENSKSKILGKFLGKYRSGLLQALMVLTYDFPKKDATTDVILGIFQSIPNSCFYEHS